jgi:hypothetical protein
MSADKNNCDIKAAKNNIIEINYKKYLNGSKLL